jgi:hypothetical protein
MKRLIMFATFIVAALGLLAGFSGAAAADTHGPIGFESGEGYTAGLSIDGQQGWSNTGGFDAVVANVGDFTAATGYGFDNQALRVSDAVTSGTFGNQTFSPGLSQAAGEYPAATHFQASFKIGTTSAALQSGLHMSVSPDNGSGGRMSYLRFEDQSTGVHVFFDDTTDSGPLGTVATFNETDIATLSRTSSHTIGFSIDFKPGPANDVVKITIDGSVVKTGTTWEDFYRYDPEQVPNQVPLTNSLLFRESGSNDPLNAGGGFLVDGVSLTSASPTCTPTGFNGLTAAQIGGNVTGTLDASGCNIGVYYDSTHTGGVSGAEIYGATSYGVLVNGAAGVNVTGSSIHNIGEVPLNGAQHGNAVYYTNAASGTISGNTVGHYQKNGITAVGGSTVTISGNTVKGEGQVAYIAQNGIEVGSGATASVSGNTVSGNAYTGANNASSGGILVFGGPCYGVPYTTGVSVTKNTLTNNDVGIFLSNVAAGCTTPSPTATKDSAVNNTITNSNGTSNVSGNGYPNGYQAGISDFGNHDNIVSNKISGTGYTASFEPTTDSLYTLIDTTGSTHPHVSK